MNAVVGYIVYEDANKDLVPSVGTRDFCRRQGKPSRMPSAQKNIVVGYPRNEEVNKIEGFLPYSEDI
jgi:hypothetical protein